MALPLLLFGTGATAAEAPEQESTEVVPVCERLYTAGDHARLARAVFDHRRWQRKEPVGDRARRALEQQRLCARTEEVRQKMRGLWITQKRKFFSYRHRRRLFEHYTPYGRWAIPPEIVMCESGGSWSAYNPSGALGPYQLLGWGAPFPVHGWRDKLAHHRIASEVWAGGAGRSNWVC